VYGRRILLVDDNSTNRLILRETMSAWGILTEECASSSAALAALSERSYSLIILDNCMPTMSGFELAAQVRTFHPSIPIVMLTSDSKPGDRTRRQQLGLAGYAVKPVKRSELLVLLCTAMQPKPHSASYSLPAAKVNMPENGASTSLKLLIAEDSPDNRLLLQAYLKTSPHVLTFVENGQAAVDAFGGVNSFDLILMDMHMPVMDGLTATRTIRAIEQERGLLPIPILALTANARPEDVEMSREAGCTAHLSKPISKQNLLKAIDDHGRSRQRETPKSRPVTITIPEGLEDLIPDYLAARRSEISEMTSLLAASNYAHLRTIGHNLKGSAASYGFPELTTLGAELEAAAERGDHAAAGQQIADIENYLSAVQTALLAKLAT